MGAAAIDRYFQKGIKNSFLLLIFFLPFLASIRSSEVFELPKILFVYAMTAIIVGLWLGRMILRRQILIRRTPLDIPILLFLISQMASTIYSIDPHVSWWGWYGRFHGGLWSTISYTLLYYALAANISSPLSENSEYSDSQNLRKSESQKTRNSGTLTFRFSDFSGSRSFPSVLIFAILASAAVVSVYAILQHFGVDKDFWVQDVVNRVFSSQGQPNWLAAYLVMAIPLIFAMTISEIINHKSYSSSLRWNARYMISYFLFMIYFLALLWTKSRSGLVGLAAADAVFWSLIFCRFYLVKNRSYIDQQRPFKKEPTFPAVKKLYRLSTIVHNLYNFVVRDKDREKVNLVNLVKPFILIHILMIGLILATNNPAGEYIFQKSQLISAKISSNQIADKSDKSASDSAGLSIIRSSRSGRDSDFSGTALRKSEYGGTESGDIRRIVWNGALQLIKQRPVFGFGPETFGETYWRVRPKEHNLTSEWNFLYNKAHNEWLNLAANTGFFGLGSHLLVLGWFTIWSLKHIVNSKHQAPNNKQAPITKFQSAKRILNFGHLNFSARGGSAFGREFVWNLEFGIWNLAVLSALLGVEAVNFFGFSTVTIGTYRYLFMAAAVSAAGNTNELLKTLPDREGSSVINIVSKLLKPIADRAMTSVIQDRNRDRDRDENLKKNMGNFREYPSRSILQGLSLAVLAVAAVVVFYILSRLFIFLIADLAYNRGRAYRDGGYIQEAIEPLMKAVNLVPAEPVFRAELAEAEGTLATLVNHKSEIINQKDELINQLKNDSIANFEIVRRQSPQNLGFIRTQAKMLFLLGNCAPAVRSLSSEASGLAPESVATAGFGRTNEFLQGKNSGPSEDDAKICNQTLQLMKAAMEMAPTNPQLYYSFGIMLEKIGRPEAAMLYYNKAVELKPDYEKAKKILNTEY